MALPFTYDPSTDRGKVRLYVRDHRPDSFAFTDAEIDVFVAVGGSWQAAVAEAATALLADRARFGRIYSVSEDGKSRSDDEIAGVQYLEKLIAQFGGGGGGAASMPRVTVTHFARHPSDPEVIS